MASKDKPPFFSIIVSTRDRPELFLRALRSVIEQAFSDREIIVIIDGSTESNLAKYAEIESQVEGVAFCHLTHRDNGHGQSYTMNYGANIATGQYLCFLDDDDYWTDDTYLSTVHESISAASKPVEVHYSHQKAFFSDGTEQTDSVWIEDLIPRLQASSNNHRDSYFVDTDFLLSSGGFAHLNCSVFNRDFFSIIGGMDESIRYENDRDVYIRAIDAANVILLSTKYMSLHNIPDVNKKSNMSTASSAIEKKLYQMRVYDKGISLGQRPSVVHICTKGKIYELKHTANILEAQNEYTKAAHYAREALVGGFNFRWLAYTLYLSFKALRNRGNVVNSKTE